MNTARTQSYCAQAWDDDALPCLIDYIRIPNKSPAFDPDWEKHGHMERATLQFADWCRKQDIDGLTVEIVRLPGRTPLIYMDVPGAGGDPILLYGHLDKQPEMSGWRDGLGPWQPVVEGDKLYGRGSADDGYATFCALIAIRALQEQKVPHRRCVILIEASEESGSPDLPAYIDALADRIGTPELVICLDSGCGNYDQLWSTTSLRGLIGGTLRVDVLNEGVHSGDAGGVVPSSFRILRQLLDRIDDPASGAVKDPRFNVAIPEDRKRQAAQAATVLGETHFQRFPFAGGTRATAGDLRELILNRTWRPTLEITGLGGAPLPGDAGNVLRPYTEAKVSLRVPPSCDARAAVDALQALLEKDPPHGAKVSFKPDWAAPGWHAPSLQPWLERAVDEASKQFFGKPALHMGEGATIPFMGMLGEKFPKAQFLITGVLGPGANAHGPNEFLHIPYVKRLTASVASVIAAHGAEGRR